MIYTILSIILTAKVLFSNKKVIIFTDKSISFYENIPKI